jgi:hypothetical protein
MTQAQKRIWTDDERPIGGDLHVFTNPPAIGAEDFVIEYHRADLSADLVRAVLERAMTSLRISGDMGGYTVLRDLINDDEAVAAIVASVVDQ